MRGDELKPDPPEMCPNCRKPRDGLNCYATDWQGIPVVACCEVPPDRALVLQAGMSVLRWPSQEPLPE